MNEIGQKSKTHSMRFVGLEYLRVIAIGFVFWQHAMSTTGHSSLENVGPLNIGQLGVAIFLAISGGLAGLSKAPENTWLWRRLTRIYPPYLIVIVISLSAAWLTSYKPVTWDLVVMQLVGLAGLTHGGAIINVPTWFISLLLVCYFTTWLIRKASPKFAILVAILLAIMACSLKGFDALAVSHASTYFFAFWLAGQRPELRKVELGLIVICQLLLGILSTDVMLNGAVALASLAVFSGLTLPKSKVVDWLAQKSYFFYLIHGPIIVVLASLFPSEIILVVTLASLLGWSGALVLEWISDRVLQRILSLNLLVRHRVS